MRVTVPRLHLLIFSLAGLFVLVACRERDSGFVLIRADRSVAPGSAYPVAVEPSRVGAYPADTKSGAGYFYDDVLEYRVWLNPQRGAARLSGEKDYFVAFAQ